MLIETHPHLFVDDAPVSSTSIPAANARVCTIPGALLLDRGDFQIRLANSGASSKQSCALVDRMYSSRGYKSSRQHDDSVTPKRITLQVCSPTNVFGTLSICFDSGAGLAADELYRVETEEYRTRGAKVAELTRLAIDPEFGSKEVLGALFHVAYMFLGPIGNVSDVFIEVNPRHVVFYRRMLHFRQASECKMCPRVSAPAVLLHVEVKHVSEQAAMYGGAARQSRSLFPYFCSSEEERDVLNRVVSLDSRAEQASISHTIVSH